MDFNLNLSDKLTDNNLLEIKSDVLYDIIIIGGGPAGLTAAVYCMRKGIKTGLITHIIGGQVAETSGIENYMGYRYIEGFELVQKFNEQIKQFELSYKEGYRVINIKDGDKKEITLENGSKFYAKAIIIATGKSSKKLNIPGEKEFIGKGVAFCATCDAPFYKDKIVVVAGGGNSGIEASLDLVKIAKQVTVIEYTDSLIADKVLIDKLKSFSNHEIILNSQIREIKGDTKVRTIIVNNNKTGAINEIKTDGIFIEIGLIPNTDFVKKIINLNKHNEIIVDCMCKTNIKGIFAAGDVTSVPHKQIIIAAGEGSKAALTAYQYILKN